MEILIFFVCIAVFAFILAILIFDIKFHKHDFRIVDQQTVKRQPRGFVEIDIPIYRKVIIQQCACGKMKRHRIDIC